jgi:hypothetical protein
VAVTLVLGAAQDVTLSGTIGNLTRFDVPNKARWIKITPRANAAKLVRGTGTDAAAIGTDPYETIFGDETLTMRVPGSGQGPARNMDSAAAASNTRRFCLASATASLVVEVVALE